MEYKEIYNLLTKKIQKDFGKPCNKFSHGCPVCDAYLMLSILESMADLEKEK